MVYQFTGEMIRGEKKRFTNNCCLSFIADQSIISVYQTVIIIIVYSFCLFLGPIEIVILYYYFIYIIFILRLSSQILSIL